MVHNFPEQLQKSIDNLWTRSMAGGFQDDVSRLEKEVQFLMNAIRSINRACFNDEWLMEKGRDLWLLGEGRSEILRIVDEIIKKCPLDKSV